MTFTLLGENAQLSKLLSGELRVPDAENLWKVLYECY